MSVEVNSEILNERLPEVAASHTSNPTNALKELVEADVR
jgi:hypothetical protein